MKHFYHQTVRPEKDIAVLATCVRILGGSWFKSLPACHWSC